MMAGVLPAIHIVMTTLARLAALGSNYMIVGYSIWIIAFINSSTSKRHAEYWSRQSAVQQQQSLECRPDRTIKTLEGGRSIITLLKTEFTIISGFIYLVWTTLNFRGICLCVVQDSTFYLLAGYSEWRESFLLVALVQIGLILSKSSSHLVLSGSSIALLILIFGSSGNVRFSRSGLGILFGNIKCI
ncbi:Hypothetical_protein [Hexamita inflata]|uniref:Hypothetical_protein n=1 Tax=Hexamita inflata TaxID=28002 RepID=A0AA86NDH5_9EUKA|nr:Hypothetical protein HINF_LOCUS5155 [Hexamita inflata]